MPTIVPIVEGPGDVDALPVIIRRILCEKFQISGFKVRQGMKLGRGKMLDPVAFKRHLRLASMADDCVLVVVVADRDDDDCQSLVANMKSWAEEENIPIGIEVLIIDREYEAWLLAGIESLRGIRGIKDDAVSPSNLEIIRDCKGRITDLMAGSRKYSETGDQTALTTLVNLDHVHSRCHSFRKLVSKLEKHVLQFCLAGSE